MYIDFADLYLLSVIFFQHKKAGGLWLLNVLLPVRSGTSVSYLCLQIQIQISQAY